MVTNPNRIHSGISLVLFCLSSGNQRNGNALTVDSPNLDLPGMGVEAMEGRRDRVVNIVMPVMLFIGFCNALPGYVCSAERGIHNERR